MLLYPPPPHTHTHTHTYACTHAHMHACTHAHTHAHTHTHTYTYTHHTHTHTHHTHIHTHTTHTYTPHTNTHTHTPHTQTDQSLWRGGEPHEETGASWIEELGAQQLKPLPPQSPPVQTLLPDKGDLKQPTPVPEVKVLCHFVGLQQKYSLDPSVTQTQEHSKYLENQHTRGLISTRKTSHKDDNKDLSCLR